MKRFGFQSLFFCFMLLFFVSCSQENDNLITSFTDTILEGEDSVVVIPTNSANWNISCVYNPDGLPIYDINGLPLQLKGLGEISSSWFRIKRESSMELKVEVDENFDVGTRGMIIELSQGPILENITIRQKKSEGYVFSKIDYMLEDGDGITEFNKPYASGAILFVMNNKTSVDQKMILSPYKELQSESIFISDDATAFSWTSGGEVEVRVPANISHGTIFYDNSLRKYNKQPTQFSSKINDQTFDVKVPANSVSTSQITNIKYQKIQATYYMTLISRRTKAEKHIKGRWTQTSPIDCVIKTDNKTFK